jgi:hypothetical protein
MAGKPNTPPGGRERRGSPEFRARAQQAYEVLREMIREHGGSDIAEGLSDKPTIEDVMRSQPEMVGALLDSAWQLKSHSKLTSYFKSGAGDDVLVEDQSHPIKPCGRTYDEVIQAHLYGSARLFFKRKENAWVKAQSSNLKKLDKSVIGGPINLVRRMMGMKPKINEEALRNLNPRKGLYESLKPYLLHRDQFKYIQEYSELSTKSATIISDIFENLRSSAALRVACRISPEALMNARACAFAYAESEIFAEVEAAAESRVTKRNVNELRRDKPLIKRVRRHTATVFADVLNKYIESIAFVEQHKAGAETVVRSLAPLYGEETWEILGEPGAVENVINCPPTVARELGRDTRYVSIQISTFVSQLQYPDIGRDLLKIAKEKLSEEDFHRALSEEAAIKVWEKIPGLFNNQFKYQHDAKAGGDKDIRNFKYLLAESEPIIKDLKEALKIGVKARDDED